MSYYDPDKILKQLNDDRNAIIDDMNKVMKDVHAEAEKILEQVREMKQNFAWGSWEPHIVGIIPKRVKGKWYFRGDTVYRKQRFGPGGVHYKYGDTFDILKDSDGI